MLEEDLLKLADSDIEWKKYENQSALVTGATGMVGSLLVRTLVYRNRRHGSNIKVIGLIRNEEKARKLYGTLYGTGEITFVTGDVNEKTDIPFEVDYIFHTVSVTASKMMVEHPVMTIETSYTGTKNMLDLAARKKVKGMVYVSSMEVYGKPDPELQYVHEGDLGYIDLTNVRSSYSEGKRICECLCTAYASEYNVPVRSARLAQTFGAGILENDNRVYAQFARSAIQKEDIVLHTDGTSEGNYCYTRDVVKALLILGYAGRAGEAYNIVNEKSHMQIREMAEMVTEQIAGGEIKVVYDIPESAKVYGYAPPVKMHLSADKMRELGWEAEVDMKEAYLRMMHDMTE